MRFGKIIRALNVFKRTPVRINTGLGAADLCRFGIAFKEQGQFNIAIKYFKDAIKIKPDHADAHYNLGCIYLEQNKLNKATLSFNRAIQIDPDHASAHEGLGSIYTRIGRGDAAAHESDIARELKI
jgi:tetratricopeptide (TPR) repeat protein